MSITSTEKYFVFLGPDEKVIQDVKGLLNKTVEGKLILTDKKLFFGYHSNISVDKHFIATHPYIMDADLKEGLLHSAVTVSNKKETFAVSKINKKEARQIYNHLKAIIDKNK
ncbi:MAG: PH domain-containing protein [Actinomycetota bacterium]